MEFDYFYMFFRVYVEKMIRRQFLIGYQFGQEEILSVYGVFKLRFDIVGIEGQLNLVSRREEDFMY